MHSTIVIRYGELFLKGANRHFFQSLLQKNIELALQAYNCKIIKTQSRIYIEDYDAKVQEEIIDALSCVFGIYSLSVAVKVPSQIQSLKEACLEHSPKEGKFRVSVNRADPKIKQRSMDIAAEIGGFMLQNANKLKVDLFNFDFEVKIDMRENGYSYIYFQDIQALGGLPVGCSGKGLLLLSGGIDSPIAGWLMAKRGMRISAIHFHSFPYTSELARQKVLDLAKLISKYTLPIKVYIVPFTEIQQAIHSSCPAEYMITIMRRFMVRIAEKIASTNEIGALITGESLGQVASQTLESITSTNAVTNLPIFRPLIAMDKTEIITLAKKIDTFETSILPYEDCCTLFLPKNPIIRPKLLLVEKIEKSLNTDELIANAIENVEIETCGHKQ